MAEDDLQKSVQSIKDPTERKKAYYSGQREQAEKGAAAGDRGASKTAAKIAYKNKQGDKTDYYNTESVAGKGVADAFKGLNSLEKKAIPFAVPEARGASIARGLVPKAAEAVGSGLSELGSRASQFLGRAKPVAAKLEGGARKIEGAAQKALTGGKGAKKASDGVYEIKGGGTTKKALEGPKGAGRAKSSPMKRGTPNEMRYNPQSGKMVGKSPMRIQSDATIRQGRKAQMEETAEMNKAEAKQAPKKSKGTSVTDKLVSRAAKSRGHVNVKDQGDTSKPAKNKAKSKARST